MNDSTFDNANTAQLVSDFRVVTQRLRSEVGRIIVGQDEVVEHLLVTLLVGGHCLVTGMPGTAKTLLVRTLADALGLQFDRIQFTPDLMPTDITGTDIIEEDDSGKRSWRFVPGPIFTNVLLADEINRTPPKTQAALLEAMQEYTATVRGTQHAIQKPFFVLATQNPLELEGTYPLPEAQLDRFLFNIVLDYLPLEDELKVVERFTTDTPPAPVVACTNRAQILAFQSLTRQVPVSRQVGRYAVELVRATRPGDPAASKKVKQYVKFGASVRAALFITLAAKARALMAGRYHVTTDDINALAAPVLRHRVMLNYFAEADGVGIDDVLRDVVDSRTVA
ncbi:MoxR family ATPase [Granulosicoccus sp.]|nr:MoxR family ATPase [Granulosicoccus sp.]MDB4223289.1 MoxR family ATPase [Granulosicoccus sp.]